MIISAIEQFKILDIRLCSKWADTYNQSDRQINDYLVDTMMGVLATIPNITVNQDRNELNLKHEVMEELEFLIDLLNTNCRHNSYGEF